MLLTLLQAKLHRVRVTEADLDYEGSCGIDEALLEASGLRVNQYIELYNINNGERFSTYIIKAPRGSGTISLNGAAARKAMVDQVKADVRTEGIAAAPTLGLTTSNVAVCFKTQDTAERSCDSAQTDNCPRAERMVGCLAVVVVSTTYHPFTPFISAIFSSIPITSTSIVAIEYVCPARDATVLTCP